MHRNNCALSDLKLRSCLSLLCQQNWGRNKNANLVWLGLNRQEDFFFKDDRMIVSRPTKAKYFF